MITDTDSEGRIKDRAVAESLKKLPDYPCQYCDHWRLGNGDVDCAKKNCTKWQAWFLSYWRGLRKQCLPLMEDKK